MKLIVISQYSQDQFQLCEKHKCNNIIDILEYKYNIKDYLHGLKARD